jgi:hypothetical protein
LPFSEISRLRQKRSLIEAAPLAQSVMAKFFNILAASVGSGLVLGASIRLGEALGSKLKAGKPEAVSGKRYASPMPSALMGRLDRLDEKMSRAFLQREPPVADAVWDPEWRSVVAGVVARIDRQQSDVDSIMQQVSKATRMLDSAGDIANHLRSDLQKELSRNLDERLAAVEARVHLRMEASHAQTLDAMVSTMENRVTPRIVQLESEIAGQTAAVNELRECALQSERSIQRLLGVLERVVDPAQINAAPPKQGGARHDMGENAPVDPSRPMPYSFAAFKTIS